MTNIDSLLKKEKLNFANKDPSSQSYGFSSSHMWMWDLDYKEDWAPKNWCLLSNCGVGEDSFFFFFIFFFCSEFCHTLKWNSHEFTCVPLDGPLDSIEIKPVNPKGNQPWIFIGRTDAKASIGLKLQYFGHLMRRTDSFEKILMLERLRAEGEGDNRGWDGWMASPTQWTWVWANYRRWWWTGRPGVLQSMGSQRAGHDWRTEQQQCVT